MRLEILIENEEPRIFPLNKPKILLGSHESCDICITGSSVSRKHLSILVEGDSYFVTDQGSTNGSFMNEERLVPGQKVEFTSFFPVRLGDNILVSLLSDDDAAAQISSSFELSSLNEMAVKTSTTSSESTRAIPLSDLQGAKTEKLIEKRAQTTIKRKSAIKPTPKKELKDNERMLGAKVLGLLIILAASFWQFYFNTPDESVAVVENKTIKKKEVVQVVPPSPQFALVDENYLVPKSKYVEIKQNISCTTEIEKYFCQSAPRVSATVQVGSKVYVFFEGSEFYEIAKKLMWETGLQDHDRVEASFRDKFRQQLMFVAFLQYFFKAFPKDFNASQFQGLDLIFVMNVNFDAKTSDFATVAIVPEVLMQLLTKLEVGAFDTAKKYGVGTLDKFNDYFLFY
jgi:pSer/pThr/pTyr-binding forkhead associated (FHA) protein